MPNTSLAIFERMRAHPDFQRLVESDPPFRAIHQLQPGFRDNLKPTGSGETQSLLFRAAPAKTFAATSRSPNRLMWATFDPSSGHTNGASVQHCLFGINHSINVLIFDFHGCRGVFCLRFCLGDDEGNGIAAIVYSLSHNIGMSRLTKLPPSSRLGRKEVESGRRWGISAAVKTSAHLPWSEFLLDWTI